MESENIEKSRTQIKREYQEVQKLGVELMTLSKQQLKCLDLPDELMEALDEAKKIKSKPAAQRHQNHIGSLMKNVDPGPIRQALKNISDGKPIESETTLEIRSWIEKLINGDNTIIESFLKIYTGAERQTLMQLVRNTIKEKTAGKIGKERKSLKSLKRFVTKCINEK